MKSCKTCSEGCPIEEGICAGWTPHAGSFYRIATKQAAQIKQLHWIGTERRRQREKALDRVRQLSADLAAKGAEIARLHGVILEMHNLARGEIYTKGNDAAGSWAKAVNRLGFSNQAKRTIHVSEGANP